MSKEIICPFGSCYSLTCLLILAGLFHLTASRPQDYCDRTDIQQWPEYLERCGENNGLCSVLNCTILHPDKEEVCYTKPTLLPVEFCQSLRDLKIPEDCSTPCCQELKNFVPEGLQRSSNCVQLCNFKDATSQLCQYLKLAIQTHYPLTVPSINGIKDEVDSAGLANIVNDNKTNISNSSPAVITNLVDNMTPPNHQNTSLPEQPKEKIVEQEIKNENLPAIISTSTTIATELPAGGNELPADENDAGNIKEEIAPDTAQNEVNKVESQEVEDNSINELPEITDSANSEDEVINDNAENKDNTDTGNVDADQVIDYPMPERNKAADAEEEAYENSDIVDVDAAGGIDTGPYPPNNKVQDTMNTGPYADDDSSFMGYFMMISVVCILAYLVFHNKQKILALVLEGRRSQGSRRRSGGRVYNKLDSTVEDSMNLNRESSLKQVIY